MTEPGSGGPSPPPAAAPPRRGVVVPRWLVVVVVLAVVFSGGFAIGRWAIDDNSTTTGGATPGGSVSPSTPNDSASSVLPGLLVQQGDVGSTINVQLLRGGNQVGGETTLDLCNGTFPSESDRTARLQVVALDNQGDNVLSTEAVLYSTPGESAQAFKELKSVAAKCPSTPVMSPVGEPTVTTRFKTAPDGDWPNVPGVDRLAYSFVSTDQSGKADPGAAVYLRRGRALMGIYFAQPDGPQAAVSGETTIARIVNLFATRLAHLPASAVNP